MINAIKKLGAIYLLFGCGFLAGCAYVGFIVGIGHVGTARSIKVENVIPDGGWTQWRRLHHL